jgi:hypothetical protein
MEAILFGSQESSLVDPNEPEDIGPYILEDKFYDHEQPYCFYLYHDERNPDLKFIGQVIPRSLLSCDPTLDKELHRNSELALRLNYPTLAKYHDRYLTGK